MSIVAFQQFFQGQGQGVACPTITIGAMNFAGGSQPVVGVYTTAGAAISGGSSPYTLTGTTGTVPPGLTCGVVEFAGTWYVALSGSPTTFGSYSFTANIEDSNGCPANRTFSITIGVRGRVVSQSINSGGSVTRINMSVSGASNQLGVNCKIQNVKFSTTTNPNADLSLYLLDPAEFASVALIDVGYLSGQNVTNAVIWPESTGYPYINAGTAPYTDNFDTIDPYSIFDGLDPNGTWFIDVYMEGAGGNTLDELVLTIIPI